MSSLLKIGELAKQTGLSIRTLHYDDEIELLCPSHRTEAGHRLYDDQDIIRLQQTVQRLAWSWRANMTSFIHGDRQLYESMVKMYQREGPEAASLGTLDNATFEYILKAVSFLSLAEDMDLVVSFKRFNQAANQVIVLGQDAIRQLNFNFFGTEGILLGLLAEGESVAAKILTDAGVSFSTAQQIIQQWLGSEAVSPEEVPEQLAFAPRAFRVLELALEALNQTAAKASSGPMRGTPGHLKLAMSG